MYNAIFLMKLQLGDMLIRIPENEWRIVFINTQSTIVSCWGLFLRFSLYIVKVVEFRLASTHDNLPFALLGGFYAKKQKSRLRSKQFSDDMDTSSMANDYTVLNWVIIDLWIPK